MKFSHLQCLSVLQFVIKLLKEELFNILFYLNQ